ncbi:MAG TPA: maleylpyruvate isomerase family mycothiol-dependent enzyme, partial [Streptosporangiaceae bacterium]
FAADGVSELLTCFITRPGGELRADPAVRLRVRCTDAGGDWLVTIGPDRVVTTSPADAGDCVVTGPACDLYLALWNRRPAGELTVRGDPAVLSLFLDRVHVRWS